MPASHLHSLNQLAGKETEPQGLCQAAGEPPIALLVGLMEASCFNFGKPRQRLHCLLQLSPFAPKLHSWRVQGLPAGAVKPPDCRDMRLSSGLDRAWHAVCDLFYQIAHEAMRSETP
jgi:hypothetical protein